MHVVPALHPAHILRQNAKLAGTVEHALSRAVALAYGKWKPKWSESEFDLNPTADRIVASLRRMAGRAVAYDVETDGAHPKECQLRCIGFYDGREGIIVPLLFRDGEREDVPEMQDDGSVKMVNRARWVPYFKGEALQKVLGAVRDLMLGVEVRSVTETKVRKAKTTSAKTAARVQKGNKKALKKDVGNSAWVIPWEELNAAATSTGSRRARCLYTQNGQYDRLVLQQALGLDIRAGDTGFSFDTIVAHHVIASYLPHKLGFLAALYTEAPFYKTTDDGEAWSAATDAELWRYCLRDVKATWLAAEQMRGQLSEAFPTAEQVFVHDMWQELECQRWKSVGIELDLPTLRYFRQHYVTVRQKALQAMKQVIEDVAFGKKDERNEYFEQLIYKLEVKSAKEARRRARRGLEELGEDESLASDGSARTVEVFNPASLIELRFMLQGLNIPLTELTTTGQLSTAKELLTSARKALLAQKVSPDDPRIAFLDYLFAWRESAKVVGTYLYPDVLRDGRVHPNFNVHVVPTGRLSSSGPNFQNQPAEIRGMFVARVGHVLVSMDWDALEMRLGAYLSQDKVFLEVFRKYDAKTGPKPHIANMAAIFKLPATKEAAEQNPGMYRAAKVFAYAVAYGAGEDTVYEQVREELPDMSWEDFKVAFENYKKTYPELFAFQAQVVRDATKQGFLDSGLLRRRIFFFERAYGESSPEATAMQNAPYQSTGADVVSLANRRIMERLVLPIRHGTHPKLALREGEVLEQLAQVHDELVFEVPVRIAEEFMSECKAIAEEKPARLRVVDGRAQGWEQLDWHLPVDIHYSRRWKPVQARCGAERIEMTELSAVGGKTKKKVERKVKCKELLEVELTETTADVERWTGECPKCKTKKVIDVARSGMAA